MARKVRVGVLMGGASAEREISLASGKMIAEHLPRDRYDVVMLDTLALMAANPRLTPELRQRARALLERRAFVEELPERERSLPASFQAEIREAAGATLPATEALAALGGTAGIDVAFLALHGPYGEDGTLQGMLDLIGIPYVGSGTLASAVAMDKAMARKLLVAEGLAVPKGFAFDAADLAEDRARVLRAAAALLPAVVKPSRQGSSIGMSLVSDAAGLSPALEAALAFDSRVLVEERVAGTELTVGVVGNRRLQALPVVEIVPKHAFFDYQAKYDPSLSEEICPARLPERTTREVQELAERAHRALDCRGLSRTDLILSANGPVVLEVNTMPGMTINSLLPKAAKAAGIPFGDLLDRLVRLALGEEA